MTPAVATPTSPSLTPHRGSAAPASAAASGSRRPNGDVGIGATRSTPKTATGPAATGPAA